MNGGQKPLHPFFTRPDDGLPLPAALSTLSSQPDEDRIRSKRRRTTKDEAQDVGPPSAEDYTSLRAHLSNPSPKSLQDEEDCVPSTPELSRATEPNATLNATLIVPAAELPGTDQRSTTPKKTLRLNGKGTFSSPVSKTTSATPPTGAEGAPKKRGRPKGKKTLDRQRVVVCRYGASGRASAIGQQIHRIMSGSERLLSPDKVQKPPAKTVAETARDTHPFFRGKVSPPSTDTTNDPVAKDTTANVQQSPARKPSAVTPGKLRAQAQSIRALQNSSSSRVPRTTQAAARHSRQNDAPWPSKESMHVRDLPVVSPSHCGVRQHLTFEAPSGKRKIRQTTFELSESLLHEFKSSLEFEDRPSLRPDGFIDPPALLRLPQKLLITGPQIQTLVQEHIGVLLDSQQSCEYQPTRTGLSQGSLDAHPALQEMYKAIETQLTPYDDGKSEVLPWAQKYAPKSVAQVLQTGREAGILRDWMHALTVNAVDSANSQPFNADRKPKKKRRKKADDLDGFLVSSDDDTNDMDELSEPEGEAQLWSKPGSQRRTEVRAAPTVDKDGRKVGKTAPAILLSGPHGCGKSALVRAVAKELSFEVFEINAGSRRSGKDVLERVGDMMGNHLVQHHATDTGNTSADEDLSRLTNAVRKDLESGRQGTMNSSFKPKTSSQVHKKHQPAKAKVKETMTTTKTGPPRNQKQSVILLEEVDIMFEEDKGFWTTVLSLITTSKRPVILTCNDESLVPINSISLHGILRLSPPPARLTTDYLLLLAAREGHILHRDAVATLYGMRHHDLRAAITDLQLWCQMGVGDPRGGLGWIFQRWPPGNGVDQNGRALRVVSKDTFHAGMGCLGYEEVCGNKQDKDEELLLQAWQDWQLDPRDELFVRRERDQGLAALDSPKTPQARLAALKLFELELDSLSATDMFAKVGLPHDSETSSSVLLDATQPDLSAKTRSSYVEGLPLLQTDDMTDFSGFDCSIVITTCRLAGRVHNKGDAFNPSQERHLLRKIEEKQTCANGITTISRLDFSAAFDPISEPPINALPTGPSLIASVFDGPLAPIAADIAPYVRSIVQFDLALEEQRHRLSNLLGVTSAKRSRTTRAARSALEGSQRASTRRERWFPQQLDMDKVLRTGGRDWPKTALSVDDSWREPSQPASLDGSVDEMEMQ